MSNWRLRPPDAFPPIFRQLLDLAWKSATLDRDGESLRYDIASGLTKPQARNLADRFHCFRWCLRQYPLHPLHHIERDWEVKLRKLTEPDGIRLQMFVRKPPSDDPLLTALRG